MTDVNKFTHLPYKVIMHSEDLLGLSVMHGFSEFIKGEGLENKIVVRRPTRQGFLSKPFHDPWTR
jgi:hypothetical protein